jgi:hypothetical protein
MGAGPAGYHFARANCSAPATGITSGTVSWTTVTLPVGRYELICNVPNHPADGMYEQLTVTWVVRCGERPDAARFDTRREALRRPDFDRRRFGSGNGLSAAQDRPS